MLCSAWLRMPLALVPLVQMMSMSCTQGSKPCCVVCVCACVSMRLHVCDCMHGVLCKV